jgi:hypothetical protein
LLLLLLLMMMMTTTMMTTMMTGERIPRALRVEFAIRAYG